ncbi:uncharacterized protein LOC133912882 isoform X1 [Phragmites australis]|uniref:uncharacterized protein LOC133912882 isoform X1 n=2 Tax=Phragmites australis TaxID=29695 RepID=UPI002D770424|nr:uncharacterized protein LOC133912882 isoform X1 [Phragmites australis]
MAFFDLNKCLDEDHSGQGRSEVLQDFDLNRYPEEQIPHQDYTYQLVLRDFDLNLVPQQEIEVERPYQGSAASNGHIIKYSCKKELTNDQRKEVYKALALRSTKGKVSREIVKDIAASFLVSPRTVWHIWRRASQCFKQGENIDVTKKRYNCGRKDLLVDLSKMQDIPVSKRTTLDDLSRHLHVSKTKLWKLKQQGQIKRHSNTIKPLLKDENKKERLRWCISMLDPSSINCDPIFKDFSDIVYIDEKWFYLTRKTERYYLLPDEEEPIRTCKSKNFIPKVMFLCAVARPRMASEGNCTFDGKIGCFPMVTYEVARRSSKNRVAGTLEMKPIMSITKEVMRSFIIEKVLPAIRAKWPSEDIGKPIYIQQDNARPHVDPGDPLFCEAAQQYGLNIQLVCQPPNSPDFNILDLGFFSAIQSIQYKKAARTVPELVAAVEQAFQEYSPILSNRMFSTLQLVMIEAMKVGGGNNYKIPHINKASLEREYNLPTQMKCDLNLVQEVCRKID